MIDVREFIECNRVKKINPLKYWTNVPVRTENLYSARKVNIYYSHQKNLKTSHHNGIETSHLW